jgi:predicted amidophosphoribosyltransferase
MGLEILSVASYYHTPGARQLAHAIKRGDEAAITSAAEAMALLVPPGAVLVPIPGRTGKATVARRLAEVIAERTGAVVADVLEGAERESLYDLKRRGVTPTLKSLGMRRIGELPPGTPVLVDNVVATGTTAAAAAAALAVRTGGKVLVHSVARRRNPAEAPPPSLHCRTPNQKNAPRT